MDKLNYRERFKRTLNHQPVDRVPFDIGGTPMTGVEGNVIEKLRDYLGFSSKNTEASGKFAQFTHFDERILRYFDIDVRRTGSMMAPQDSNYKKISDKVYVDAWGIKRAWTGLYWDIIDYPLKGASITDLDKYPWPDPETIDLGEIESYKNIAKKLYEETPYVVCAEHPVYGIFELGCWLCSFDYFLYKMAAEPEFVHKFFEIILEYQKKIIDVYYKALGPYIHFTTSGDDFGTQNALFLSPEMFRKMIKTYFKKRIDYTKKYTDAAFFHHSCGSIYQIIPDLIEIGVDILNPIQPGAKDMEPECLKAEFGDSITFYGGVDTQELLPNGTQKEIEENVFHLLDKMSDNGGYVFAAAHNIQQDVPPENIVAMFNSARRYFKHNQTK